MSRRQILSLSIIIISIKNLICEFISSLFAKKKVHEDERFSGRDEGRN